MPGKSLLRSSFLGLIAIIFLFAGCDDPSTVGMGLVESQAGDPEVSTLSATLSNSDGLADMTGGTQQSGAFRALFGQVDDPVAGPYSMTGVMDFVPGSDVDTAFKVTSVEFAELLLNLDYVYGDTTLDLTLNVYEVDQAWDAGNARADTFIVARSLVTTVTFTPEPGMIRIELPTEWVNDHDADLRSDSFADEFHGFSFQVSDGNAIGGIHLSSSELRASSVPGDTVGFPLSKVLSTSSLQDGPQNSDLFVLRDGAAEAASLNIPIDPDLFGQAAIHRSILRLDVDDLTGLYPVGFNRPGLAEVGLRAVAEDNETRLDVLEVAVTEDGPLSFESDALANILQSANLGNSGLDRFELYIPNESSTVDFVAIRSGTPQNMGPRAIITFTPLNR